MCDEALGCERGRCYAARWKPVKRWGFPCRGRGRPHDTPAPLPIFPCAARDPTLPNSLLTLAGPSRTFGPRRSRSRLPSPLGRISLIWLLELARSRPSLQHLPRFFMAGHFQCSTVRLLKSCRSQNPVSAEPVFPFASPARPGPHPPGAGKNPRQGWQPRCLLPP